MKVIATEKGYFGQIREAGDEFEVPDDVGDSNWFKPVKEAKDEQANQRRQDQPRGKNAAANADPI